MCVRSTTYARSCPGQSSHTKCATPVPCSGTSMLRGRSPGAVSTIHKLSHQPGKGSSRQRSATRPGRTGWGQTNRHLGRHLAVELRAGDGLGDDRRGKDEQGGDAENENEHECPSIAGSALVDRPSGSETETPVPCASRDRARRRAQAPPEQEHSRSRPPVRKCLERQAGLVRA